MKRYLAIIVVSVCFAAIGTLVKLIGDSVPIMTLNFFRFFIGFLFIAAFVPFIDRSFLKVSRRDIMEYALLGLMIANGFSMHIAAYNLSPVSNVVLVSSMFPVFVAVFSYLVLKEKTDKASLISFLIAFLGVLVITPFRPAFFAGSMLSMSGAILYGAVLVFMRQIDEKRSIGVVFWFLGFAALFTAPYSLYYGLGNIQSSFVWILLLGVVSTGMAYLLLNFTLEKMPAETTSLIILTVQPMAAILLAFLVLGETVNLNIIIGGILIIAGGIFLEVKKSLFKKY